VFFGRTGTGLDDHLVLFLRPEIDILRGAEDSLLYVACVAESPADVDLTMVTMVFDASDPDGLVSVLAKYVVLSRGQPGCRNIDLCASATSPGRFVVIQKWETPEAQRAHFDSGEMIEMANACTGLLTNPPAIDLLEPISAHDLH